MENRWSIWMDVEGFSALYKSNSTLVIQHLSFLMEALYKIGIYVFKLGSERLFIHQFGDGFIIVSDFPEKNPRRPLAISIAVMRHLMKKKVITKAVVSAGDFADISSCYPRMVMSASQERRLVRIGEGIMTIIPVMGMALIAAHKLAQEDIGALLLIDCSMFSEITDGVVFNSEKPSTVDWVHTELQDVMDICGKASLDKVSSEEAEGIISAYIEDNRHRLPRKWVKRTYETLFLRGGHP